MAGLSDVKSRLEQLQAAHQQKQRLDDDLQRIRGELDRIPTEGRRDLSQLKQEIGQIQRRITQHQQQINQQQQELSRKEQQQLQYQDLEPQRQQLASQASNYKTLAYQLGRDRLQSHLLQKVEYEIVTKANQHLDKMSSGQLSLELEKEEQTTEGESPTSHPLASIHSLALLAQASDPAPSARPRREEDGQDNHKITNTEARE